MLVKSTSEYSYARKNSGGKGFNLYKLSKLGIPVPPWIVFGKRCYEKFLDANNLLPQISTLVDEYVSKVKTGKRVEDAIHLLFEKSSFTDEIEKYIEDTLGQLGHDSFVAVRSSAIDEDGSQHSYAGQFNTYLFVKGKDAIKNAIKGCWSSLFSERSLSYRLSNGINFERLSMAVVIQKMVNADRAGVLFTCDPVEKTNDNFVVSSVFGVGEGLVSGKLSADTFWVDSQNGLIKKSSIVPKEEKFIREDSGGYKIVPVAKNEQEVESLNHEELLKLHALAKKILNYYSRPQDIEWGIEDNKVYILQSRPVTQLDVELQGFMNLWDNSNIVESYGGITLPLSFTFALRNYKNVYVQFCEVLGLSKEIIKDMDSYLSHMLGLINGRVYYNLFNWYKLVGVLPGFRSNKAFMETMMGVTEELNQEVEERISPHPSWETWRGKLRKIITGFNFLKYHFTINSLVEDFLTSFKKDYQYYKDKPLEQMRGDELMEIYLKIERNMLGRWKAPIINDFLCMVHFGLLKKLTDKWIGGDLGSIQNDLLSAEGGLESALPFKVLLSLSEKASQNPKLKELIISTPPSDCLEELNQSEFTEFYSEVLSYIDQFGFRCMNEMKLEEIDLSMDSSYLFVCLKNYLATSTSSKGHTSEIEIRKNAEGKINEKLSGWKKVVYWWVLKNARLAVKNRENTRFARTRIYGIARKVFNNIGEDLAGGGIIPHARDVFWLTFDEVVGIYNGTLIHSNLTDQIALRKKEYEKFSEEPNPRILTRGHVYWNNSFFTINAPQTPSGDFDLVGLPCCPGIIEGIIKVINDPRDDLQLKGEILVTKRTDPGWVPLYPSISGLLVERGSLLSHSAIVAREMGIPAIVSIPSLTKVLKTGMKVRIDGKAGTVKILEN